MHDLSHSRDCWFWLPEKRSLGACGNSRRIEAKGGQDLFGVAVSEELSRSPEHANRWHDESVLGSHACKSISEEGTGTSNSSPIFSAHDDAMVKGVEKHFWIRRTDHSGVVDSGVEALVGEEFCGDEAALRHLADS